MAATLLALSGSHGTIAHGDASRASSVCPQARQVLAGVWGPRRLRVINPCQRATGIVTDLDRERDGDLHIAVALDARYRYLLDRANYTKTFGDLVVELMPRDGGHLPAPRLHDRVTLIGAWVNDTDGSWHELHPVWYLRVNAWPAGTSGPQFGGSPSSTGSENAAAQCRTQTGAACRGYARIRSTRFMPD